MRDREGRHITNEAANEISIVPTPASLREAFETITQQLYADPYEYPGDEYGGEITGGDEPRLTLDRGEIAGGAEPRLMLDIDSSGYLGATAEHEGEGEFFRVMIRNNRYIPQWKNRWDDVWNYFPDDDELGVPRNCRTYGEACEFIGRFFHTNVTDIPLTSIIGREELPDEKIYLYYR